MKQLIKVHMLPTKDKTHIIKSIKTGILKYCDKLESWSSGKQWINQHLYITVSQDVEKPKDGDWCFFNVGYASGVRQINQEDIKEESFKDCFNKVISTSDPKLLKEHDDTVPYPKMRSTIIAELQQSFLKEYVANPDGQFEVEYEEHLEMNDPSGKYTEYTLKLNQDNEVIITSIGNDIYKWEEVEEFGRQAFYNGREVERYNENGLAIFKRPTYNGYLRELDKGITSVEEEMYSGIDLMGNQDGSLDHFLLNSPKFSQEEREIIMDAVYDWVQKNL